MSQIVNMPKGAVAGNDGIVRARLNDGNIYMVGNVVQQNNGMLVFQPYQQPVPDKPIQSMPQNVAPTRYGGYQQQMPNPMYGAKDLFNTQTTTPATSSYRGQINTKPNNEIKKESPVKKDYTPVKIQKKINIHESDTPIEISVGWDSILKHIGAVAGNISMPLYTITEVTITKDIEVAPLRDTVFNIDSGVFMDITDPVISNIIVKYINTAISKYSIEEYADIKDIKQLAKNDETLHQELSSIFDSIKEDVLSKDLIPGMNVDIPILNKVLLINDNDLKTEIHSIDTLKEVTVPEDSLLHPIIMQIMPEYIIVNNLVFSVDENRIKIYHIIP